MTDPFQRKTWGRIFVNSPAHVVSVRDAIEEMDHFEATYMPHDLVAVYERGPNNELVYLHKFEIDKIALTMKCIDMGVWIWCVDGAQSAWELRGVPPAQGEAVKP